MDTVKIENVCLSSDLLTQIWLGFIAMGYPCNIRDCGAGRHTIEVTMPKGQNANATAILRKLGGA